MTDPKPIGTIEVRFEFDHAVCRPCLGWDPFSGDPKPAEDGRCVGLTEEGLTEAWEGRSRDVASVTDRSLEDRGVRGEVKKQVLKLGGGSATVWGVILSHPQPNPKEFDMGYIKMQAIGPGQCVVKADLTDYFECCGTDGMPAPDGHRYKWPQDEPKIPVAANKLVNCPPGGCLPSAPPTPPTPPPPSPPPPPPPPPSHREVWTYNAATRTYTKKSFKVLGHIDGREILNKSKNCTRKWWPKWKKTKKATCTNKGKNATCMKLKNKCTVPVEDYA